MRFVVVFFAIAGLWLVVNGYWDGRRGLDEVGHYLGFDRVADDAPNWGDVAAKIGELAEERGVLREGFEPEGEPPAE